MRDRLAAATHRSNWPKEIALLVPGEHRFDGELRQGLQPRENRQSKALRDKELR